MAGQAGCDEAQEGKAPWGEDGFWNPSGRRRGGRGELQGPCNHCFAEGGKGLSLDPYLARCAANVILSQRSVDSVNGPVLC